MPRHRRWSYRVFLMAAPVLCLALAFASSGVRSPDYDRMNDRCILCHLQTFNAGISFRHLHAPFFERRCTACHLGADPEGMNDSPAPVPGRGGQGTFSSGAARPVPRVHPPLARLEALAIDACMTCHPRGELGLTHPVGIYSRSAETSIPDELPTIREGMATCVTCHEPHGSLRGKLVREVITSRRCVACHLGAGDGAVGAILLR